MRCSFWINSPPSTPPQCPSLWGQNSPVVPLLTFLSPADPNRRRLYDLYGEQGLLSEDGHLFNMGLAGLLVTPRLFRELAQGVGKRSPTVSNIENWAIQPSPRPLRLNAGQRHDVGASPLSPESRPSTVRVRMLWDRPPRLHALPHPRRCPGWPPLAQSPLNRFRCERRTYPVFFPPTGPLACL